ncbi:MAG: tRNA epoxyqueuosine(34) reductase QueG [Ilumatobacter sp.]|nr:tRNA epoxyqueuosine(34) reductase QueG [Ilumatobacter sp.]
MRPPDPPPPAADAAYVAELAALTQPFGVTHTGVAPATVMEGARRQLRDRLERGLTDGMQFTFKNPERSTDPGQAVRGACSVFVAARPYFMGGSEPGAAGTAHRLTGRIARYAWEDHYAPLRKALWGVSRRLRADGWKAVPFADDNSIVDREVAYRAGIGWYGKNANLLLPGAGSWFVLGCVVTNAPLPPAEAPVADGCGACRRCLDGCPTGAIITPGVVDAARCLAWVLQKPGAIPEHLREAVGDRLYGCDDCQEVCPPAVRFGPRHQVPPGSTGSAPRPQVDLLEVLQADDAGVMALWGRWYLADRDPRWVRRNALVALGNAGSAAAGDARVAALLARYRVHSDPVLREHAEWATRRLLGDQSPTAAPSAAPSPEPS